MFQLSFSQRAISPHACLLLAACAVITTSVFGQLAAPTIVDRGDARFLEQLIQRRMFAQAERYCSDRIAQRKSVDERAWWVDRLADTSRRHAWFTEAANRQALTDDAVEVITGFLKDNVVEPETELALRLNQMKTLRDVARMQLVQWQAGHAGPLRPDAFRPGFKLPSARRTLELAEAMARQISNHRRDLDTARTDRLREAARLLEAEALCLISLSTDPDDPQADALQQSAWQKTARLRREARDPAVTIAATRLLGELQLAENDFDGLSITIAQLSDASATHERLRLVIRSHLRQGRAVEALALCEEARRSAGAPHPDVDALVLEAALVLRIYGDQLNDSDLISQADEKFNEVSGIALAQPPSVDRDVADRVIARYHLVQTVGADVADLVDQVDFLRAAADHKAALQVIERAIRQLPPDALPQSRAALSLRQGEMLIALKRWDDALVPLRLAETVYSECRHSGPASAASLLRSFVIGQQWKAQPDNRALREQWICALSDHRSRWPRESSSRQATEWLLDAVEKSDPVFAADILEQTIDDADEDDERFRRLRALGRQLVQLAGPAARESSPRIDATTLSTRSLENLIRTFDDSVSAEKLSDVEYLTPDQAIVWLDQAQLLADAESSGEFWDKQRNRIARIQMTVAAAGDEASGVDRTHLQLFSFVVQSRTSRGNGTLDALQSALVVAPAAERLWMARYLGAFLRDAGRIQSGDLALALTVAQLIELDVVRATSVDDLLTMLNLASRAVRVTGHPRARNRVLDRLLRARPEADELRRVADVLVGVDADESPESRQGIIDFWTGVRQDSDEGSSLWLEATLQLARLDFQQGAADRARQRLNVTEILYPGWGSPDRFARATELRDSISKNERRKS